MADRPILFSGLMVRALLDGRKTQSRRTLNPQPDDILEGQIPARLRISVGDRLWVCEGHALLPRLAYRGSIGTGTIAQQEHPTDGYTAAVFREGFDRSGRPHWRPSIHMPRWASRVTLTVTDVRVERLQDCSEADAIAEGIERHRSGWMPYSTAFYDGDGVTPANYHADPRISYMQLWDRINGRGAWDANPWVAAYTFTVERENIDATPSKPTGAAAIRNMGGEG